MSHHKGETPLFFSYTKIFIRQPGFIHVCLSLCLIITAKDGCEALKKAKEHSPDLVVMDIILPMMDGIELMGRILSERKNVPIIVNTAYGGYRDNFTTWSADAYIIKSSDLSELKNKIKELLGETECSALRK
ncbi:Alkaline phosphatase synthesis transcriptional regulatory protein PhoP [Patescibacteria group bacterium]|nr:Alkaline phosphatase synthesis transcriptional regulatory protein PhoP [Patescibacteria group bacterium]